MAAPYNPPVKNEDFVIYIALQDLANAGRFKADPTIASGDFKVKKGSGSPANLSTLPAVDAAGEIAVKVSLSATEMNDDNVVIIGRDQSEPPEWADFVLSIPTTSA
jgi:hypothetical protein